MKSYLSLGPGAPLVFPCAHCGAEVNTSLSECGSCHTKLDPQFAAAAAELEGKVSSAFSDASTLRMVAAAALVIGVVAARLSSIRSMALPGAAFVLVAFALAGVLIVRWFARFGSLRFEQLGPAPAARMAEDYKGAKAAVVHSVGLTAVSLFLLLIAIGRSGVLMDAVRFGLKPAHPSAGLLEKGDDDFNHQKYFSAADYLRQLIEIDPSATRPRLHLAYLYMYRYLTEKVDDAELGRRDGFIRKTYGEMLAKDPRDRTMLWNMAILSLMTGKWDDAQQRAEQILHVQAGSKWGNFVVGAATLGRIRDAWQEARIDPDFTAPIANARQRAKLKQEYLAVVEKGIGALAESVAGPHQENELIDEQDTLTAYGLAYQADLIDCKAQLDPGLAAELAGQSADLRRKEKEEVESKERTAMYSSMLGVASIPQLYTYHDPNLAGITYLYCALPENVVAARLSRATDVPLISSECRN